MNEAPKFHPQIEEALETDGDDVGRVKDIELAQDVASGENDSRNSEFPLSKETYDRLRSDNIKVRIAERAVKAAAETDMHNIAVSGALDQPSIAIHPGRLKDEAVRVGRDYDAVQEAARDAAEAREKDA